MDLVATAVRLPAQQGFIHQGGQNGQGGPSYRLGRRPRKAAPKDRQPHKNSLFLRRELPPGVIKDRSHAAMPFGYIIQRCCQEVQVVLYLGRYLRTGEAFQPRGGQFNSQRHAFDELAEANHIFRLHL